MSGSSLLTPSIGIIIALLHPSVRKDLKSNIDSLHSLRVSVSSAVGMVILSHGSVGCLDDADRGAR